jgi:Flp pilus assembly protein TadG
MQISRFLRQDRGGVAVLVSLLVVVFGGMLAVAVDLGHVLKVKAELQRSADAGALAGVLAMFPKGAAKNCTGAVSTGKEFVQKNKIDGLGLTTDDIVAEYGEWERNLATGQFTGVFKTSSCETANAVRVRVNKGVNMWFASMIGVNAITPVAEAVAISKIGGQTKAGEGFPFCIDKSKVPPDGEAREILINTQNSDFGCWTPFDDPNGKVKDYLDNTLTVPPLWIGKIINVKNGVTTPDLNAVEDNYIGKIVTVPVVTDGEHSGTTPILGFAKVKILGVETPGGGSGDKFLRLETLEQYYTDDGVNGGGNTDFHLGSASGATLVK